MKTSKINDSHLEFENVSFREYFATGYLALPVVFLRIYKLVNILFQSAANEIMFLDNCKICTVPGTLSRVATITVQKLIPLPMTKSIAWRMA